MCLYYRSEVVIRRCNNHVSCCNIVVSEGHPKYNTSTCYTPAGDRAVNTLRPRQDGRHFPDDIFICIFLNENEWHSIKSSQKLVPKVPINNIPTLVQIMAWCRPGDKPLSEPMMVVLPTHICVTRPQWVNTLRPEWKSMIADDIFKYIFLKENCDISIQISLKSVHTGPIDNKVPLVQVMARRLYGAKHWLNQCWPRSMVLYDITRHQWVN